MEESGGEKRKISLAEVPGGIVADWDRGGGGTRGGSTPSAINIAFSLGSLSGEQTAAEN